jgi:hypothetical protein
MGSTGKSRNKFYDDVILRARQVRPRFFHRSHIEPTGFEADG